MVEHVLNLVLGGVSSHGNRDLAVLEADAVVVIRLEMPGPALEHLVYDARLPDDVVGSLAAALLIGHAPAEVVPFGLACLLGAQHAAHLGDPTGKAQHAGVLHDHGAVAGPCTG